MKPGIISTLLIALVWLSSGMLWAGEISDGSWNGKSWDRKELDAGVTRGDPEALAEYAYCSRVGLLGIRYDENLVFIYASKSAAADNPYGMAILSQCHLVGMGTRIDAKLGYQLSKKSAEAGHPLGMKNLATCLLSGAGGATKDVEKGLELNDKAAEMGCAIAGNNRATNHLVGDYGVPRDEQKSLQLLIENFRGYRSLLAARNLVHRFSGDPEGKRFPLDLQDEVVARLREAYECGVPSVAAELGRHLCLMGQGNEGIPMIIEACESSDPWDLEAAATFSTGYGPSEAAGSAGDYSTIYRILREAVEHGSTSDFAFQWTMDSYLYKWCSEPISPEKALPYAMELSKRGSSRAPEALGRIFFSKKENPVRDKRRGMAHLIYSSRTSERCRFYLVEALVTGIAADRDFVRGYAAAVATAEDPKRISMKSLNRLMKLARKELNEEQLEEAKQLIERGYPSADEFRRPAFAILKEYGDLPMDAKYE